MGLGLGRLECLGLEGNSTRRWTLAVGPGGKAGRCFPFNSLSNRDDRDDRDQAYGNRHNRRLGLVSTSRFPRSLLGAGRLRLQGRNNAGPNTTRVPAPTARGWIDKRNVARLLPCQEAPDAEMIRELPLRADESSAGPTRD